MLSVTPRCENVRSPEEDKRRGTPEAHDAVRSPAVHPGQQRLPAVAQSTSQYVRLQ